MLRRLCTLLAVAFAALFLDAYSEEAPGVTHRELEATVDPTVPQVACNISATKDRATCTAVMINMDAPGGTMTKFYVGGDVTDCCNACAAAADCTGFSIFASVCSLKSSIAEAVPTANALLGHYKR
uniref:Secreted protein n=1 Tax=Achlya hypogyna TaxID=1202772 RepID=A0A0A7CN01_ACHHY|nr:secreted protein [Achlya hypogyna]